MKSIESKYLLILLLSLQVSCHSSQPGCTDPLASNFDSSATEEDHSCIYDIVYVSPEWTMELSEQISETSGLILWDGVLWTINDDTDTRLYLLDTATAEIIGDYLLPGVVNQDWEEISQDEDFIYVGDFGNNLGNRSNLHILRIDKRSLISGDPSIDTIWFTYSDQYDLSPSQPNMTEFDCEAFVVFSDSIYLFTKQWVSGKSTLYSLPKTPGNHKARKISFYDMGGLVAGAAGIESQRLVVLCGYSFLVQPFLILLYDYMDNDFFSGNIRVINLSLPFHQVEGITTSDGLKYYLSNEYFSSPPGRSIPQQLHQLDLTEYLNDYLNPF